MSHWWQKKWGKDQICSISYNRLRSGQKKNGILLTTTLNCGHRFCTNHLLNWISINNTCPNCRENIKLEDIILCHYNNYIKKNKDVSK
jgi:hypothetical protein